MASDSEDDDMPVLAPTRAGTENTADSVPKTNTANSSSVDSAALFHHPAALGSTQVSRFDWNPTHQHPASLEPIVRNSKAASSLKEQGNIWFKKGKIRKAEECYTQAIMTVPVGPEFDYSRAVYFGNRAACYLKLTLYDKCVDDCTSAIALSPNYVKVLMRRAKAFENKENLESALEDVKKCLEIDPSYTNARREAVRLEKAIKDKQEAMKEEVLGKLKDLGNSILGKFGINLNDFKMKKDPATGQYSMSFGQ